MYAEEKKNCGNGNIRKYPIEGDFTFLFHRKFATKTQKGNMEAVEKMQFNIGFPHS